MNIWEAKELVLRGARRSIGSGRSIPVLGSAWLPVDKDPYISSSHPDLVGANISSLISERGDEWNFQAITNLFSERDRKLILSIPLRGGEKPDGWYWRPEISGIYSVKSAYKLLQVAQGRWRDEEASIFWRGLWKLKIPPKVKDMVWRAGSGCLPTLTQLLTKHVPVQEACPLCSTEAETIFHVLVDCPPTKECWRIAGLGLNMVATGHFKDWAEEIFAGCNEEERTRVAMLCWAIWRARNEKVWNGVAWSAAQTVSFAQTQYLQWSAAREQNSMGHNPVQGGDQRLERWTRPSGNTVKVNIDAALFNEDRSWSAGTVARDASGVTLGVHKKRGWGSLRLCSLRQWE